MGLVLRHRNALSQLPEVTNSESCDVTRGGWGGPKIVLSPPPHPTLSEINMGIFLYKVVKTSDFLRVLPPEVVKTDDFLRILGRG